jgi:hypothetical protein
VVERVQVGLRGLFNPESVYIAQHGGGAGNNWASGYDQAAKAQEDLLDMLGATPCTQIQMLQGFRVAKHSGRRRASWTCSVRRHVQAVLAFCKLCTP